MSGGSTTSSSLEVVHPNRIHIVNEGFEMISIGTTAWIKSGAGWHSFSGEDFAPYVSKFDALWGDAASSLRLADVTVDSNATVDGQPAIDYRFTATDGKTGTQATGDAWLAHDSCLPMKTHLVSTVTASGTTSNFETTQTYSQWGAVSIQPPA